MSAATAAVVGLASAGASAYGAAQQRGAMADAMDMLTPFQMMKRTAKVNQQVVPTNLNTELENRQTFDPQFMQHQLDMQGQFAPQQAQQALDVNRQFAPEYLRLQQELLEQADPNAAAAQKLLGETVLGELQSGRSMSDGQRRSFLDNVRGAQVARGNFTGSAPAFQEALELSGYGDNLFQQRVSNAANFLSNVPSRSQMSAGLPNPFQPINTNAQGANFRVVDPGDAFRSMGYQSSSNQVAAQLAMAPQPNPWTAGLGAAAGVAGGYMAYRGAGGGVMPNTYQPVSVPQMQQNAWATLS